MSRRTLPDGRWLLCVAMALAALLPQRAAAQPTPDEIAERSLRAFYYAGADFRARVSMALVNAQGRQRRRDLTMLRKNLGTAGDQRYFIYFHSPPDVRGMTFMVWKLSEGDDDRWIFVPALNMVRRIAASDKRSSFVGSDFTYEDLSGRAVDDESHHLLGSEDLGGRRCFVLESRPKEPTDYVRRVAWIDEERWLPLKEEYFDSREQKVREFSADEVREVDGYWTVTKRTMRNLQTRHHTEVVFGEVSFDVGLEEDLFSERYLRRPPREWTR